MEVEQLEIRDYLSQCVPLTELSDQWLDEMTQNLEIEYMRRDTPIHTIGETNNTLRLIRKGAVEATKPDGVLHGRFVDGDWVGYRSLLAEGTKVSLNVKTIEDTLFYVIPGDFFRKLVAENERVKAYFSSSKLDRLRSAIQEMNNDKQDYTLLTTHLEDLVQPALILPRSESIRETARKMTDVKNHTALIAENNELLGIVTDQDFRQRVVAEGRDPNGAVETIMTASPFVLSPNSPASEALLLMARRNIRHIPVVSAKKIHGVVTVTDLLRQQGQNVVHLVGDIHLAKTVDDLANLSQSLPQALVNMVNNGLPAYDIGHAISSIGQAIIRRLLTMGEEQFGKPPVPYAFVVAGSMARREQTAHSDQDNGMILSDDFVPELHDDYFKQLAHFVCDALDKCGYIYCPGNIMATNDQWRQPWRVWREYFRQWIEEPDPKSLMYSSIFFDLRWVHGEKSLLHKLQGEVLESTQKSTMFQAFMAKNAMSFQPPLGFFRGFILEKHGTNEKTMDMKTRGVVPVIDLARAYALANGLFELNTFERVRALGKSSGLTQESADDLEDALEFISMVRLKHQAKQIEAGQKPDNYVPPDDLSALERRHLKDAFDVVSSMQESMGKRLQADRLG